MVLSQHLKTIWYFKILAKSQGLEWRKIKKPLELQKILSFTLLEMIDLVESKLHSEDYTIEEIFELLETTHDEIVLNCLNQNTANRKITLYIQINNLFLNRKVNFCSIF